MGHGEPLPREMQCPLCSLGGLPAAQRRPSPPQHSTWYEASGCAEQATVWVAPHRTRVSHTHTAGAVEVEEARRQSVSIGRPPGGVKAGLLTFFAGVMTAVACRGQYETAPHLGSSASCFASAFSQHGCRPSLKLPTAARGLAPLRWRSVPRLLLLLLLGCVVGLFLGR